MKILAQILAVYFLLLAVVPCADGASSELRQAHQEMVADHDHSGHEHPPGEDFCTPLCACQCCHINIILNTFPQITSTPDIIQSGASFYLDHPYATFLATLLDPPQV